MNNFPILEYFEYEHLPTGLTQDIAKSMEYTANYVMEELTKPGCNHQEIAAGLRKLLEAKDCFVRAAITLQKNRSAKV